MADSFPGHVDFKHLGDCINEIEPSQTAQDVLLHSYLSQRQIVYVSGYMGGSSGEFKDNSAMIREIVPDLPIRVVKPRSRVAVENNVENLARLLTRAASANPSRPLILIGQSKGGAECLQLVARHPEVFGELAEHQFGFRIDRLVTVSAAIGGSVLADLALDRDAELMRRWVHFKAENGITFNKFARFLERLFLQTGSKGFASLTSVSAKARNAKLVAEVTEETRQLLRRKVYFVTAYRQKPTEGLAFYMQNLSRFMCEQPEPNDGVIRERDQKLSGFGTHLFSVQNAGHFSLVGPYDETKYRRGFMRLLFLTLASLDHGARQDARRGAAGQTTRSFEFQNPSM